MAEVVAPAGGHDVLDGAPPGRDIVARDMRFGLSAAPVRRWFGGDVFRTAICDGLSIWLPTGERFFIRSLKHYLPQLDDPELAARVREFTLQEAYHTREHEDYNRALALLGYDLEEMERPVKQALHYNRTMIEDLAVTCAVEHITASFSLLVLRRSDMWRDADTRYRRLWIWHALEELEHKAVALEVFHVVTRRWSAWKRYAFRNAAMTIVLIRFAKIFFRNARLHARQDGVERLSSFVWGMTSVLLFKPGFWLQSCLDIFGYYRPGFRPEARDDSALIDWARAELDRVGPQTAAAG